MLDHSLLFGVTNNYALLSKKGWLKVSLSNFKFVKGIIHIDRHFWCFPMRGPFVTTSGESLYLHPPVQDGKWKDRFFSVVCLLESSGNGSASPLHFFHLDNTLSPCKLPFYLTQVPGYRRSPAVYSLGEPMAAFPGFNLFYFTVDNLGFLDLPRDANSAGES